MYQIFSNWLNIRKPGRLPSFLPRGNSATWLTLLRQLLENLKTISPETFRSLSQKHQLQNAHIPIGQHLNQHSPRLDAQFFWKTLSKYSFSKISIDNIHLFHLGVYPGMIQNQDACSLCLHDFLPPRSNQHFLTHVYTECPVTKYLLGRLWLQIFAPQNLTRTSIPKLNRYLYFIKCFIDL